MQSGNLNVLTGEIIQAAIAVHKELGPGLLESVYERCLALELDQRGHKVEVQVPVPITYRGLLIHDDGFRIDLLIDNEVIVELKSVEEIKPVHGKQLLTYLRLKGKSVGLLINFNVPVLKKGIVRVVNGFDDSPCCDRSVSADRSKQESLCVPCASA